MNLPLVLPNMGKANMKLRKFYLFVVCSIIGTAVSAMSLAGSSAKDSKVSSQTHLDMPAWIARLKSSNRTNTWRLLLNVSSQDFATSTAWGWSDKNNYNGPKLIDAWMSFLLDEASLDLPKNEAAFKAYINKLLALSKKLGHEGSLQSLLLRDAIYRIIACKCAKFVLANPHDVPFVDALSKTLMPFSRAEIRRAIPNDIRPQQYKKYVKALSQKKPHLLEAVMNATDPPADADGFPDTGTSELISQRNVAGFVLRLALTQLVVKVQLPAFCDYIGSGGSLEKLNPYDDRALFRKIRKMHMKYTCPLFGINHTRPTDIILASRWVEPAGVSPLLIDALR